MRQRTVSGHPAKSWQVLLSTAYVPSHLAVTQRDIHIRGNVLVVEACGKKRYQYCSIVHQKAIGISNKI